MLFVCYGTNVSVPIRNAKIRKGADVDGNLAVFVERPLYMANFQPGRMTETQRVIAVREFTLRNPKSPFGAVPYSQGDIMGEEFSTEDVMPNSVYSGFNPAFSLSRFDTREDIPYEEQGAVTDKDKQELKALTEEVLLRPEKGLGRDYIRIDDALPKPWPAYPMEQGPGVAQKIVADAKTVGVGWETVLEFEKTQDSPRKGVLSLVEAELERELEEAREQAALGAHIPA